MPRETMQPDVWAVILVPLIPAGMVLCLRFYARSIKSVPLWWDDWLAILSFISAVVYDGFTIWLLKYGMGLHLKDLPVTVEAARYYQALVQEVQEHTYTAAIGAAQLSLLALYWRLFQAITSARITIFVLIGTTVVWVIVRTAVSVFQCFPPKYFWDKSIDGECTVSAAKYFLGSVSTHLVIDIALIILPATQISRLSLPLPQKLAIVLMFTFGVVVCVASIVMLVVSARYDPTDPDIMWTFTPPAIWSAAEIHLSVMSCCLPILRPVVHAFGGWCSQNFSSRREGSLTRDSVKLASIRRSLHRMKGESTHNLADTTKTTTIYGQGEGSDTVITGKRASEDEEQGRCGIRGKDQHAILVKYEVDLSFSDTPTNVSDDAGASMHQSHSQPHSHHQQPR